MCRYLLYGEQAYMWSVAELIRKLVLTSLIILFFETGSGLQITFALLVSAFAHVAHALYRPFVNRPAYLLQHASLTVTTMMYVRPGLFWPRCHAADMCLCVCVSVSVCGCGDCRYSCGLLFKVRGFTSDEDGAGSSTAAGDSNGQVFDWLGNLLVSACCLFLIVGGSLVVVSVTRALVRGCKTGRLEEKTPLQGKPTTARRTRRANGLGGSAVSSVTLLQRSSDRGPSEDAAAVSPRALGQTRNPMFGRGDLSRGRGRASERGGRRGVRASFRPQATAAPAAHGGAGTEDGRGDDGKNGVGAAPTPTPTPTPEALRVLGGETPQWFSNPMRSPQARSAAAGGAASARSNEGVNHGLLEAARANGDGLQPWKGNPLARGKR